MSELRYPLQWPLGRPRTRFPERSKFRITPGRAHTELMAEIGRLRAKNLIVSSNIFLRKGDGIPHAGVKAPDDKGVAIYFKLNGKDYCMACDKYNSIDDNIYAIAKSIDAMRGIERWGGTSMLNEAFTGFEALPQQTDSSWWNVLRVAPDCTLEEAKSAYRKRSMDTHPDKGGSGDEFDQIQKAWAEAQKTFEK